MLFKLSPIFAQIQLSDPGIPEREYLIYSERVGERIQQIAIETKKMRMDGRQVFKVTGYSPTSESRMLIDASSMSCFLSEILEQRSDATIQRSTEIRDIKYRAKPDELIIADFNSLYFVLRGFPWASAKTAKLHILGSGSEEGTAGARSSASGPGGSSGSAAFSFELKVVGKESIVTGGRSWACWKIELGLGGIFGALFRKSFFWYSVDSPCLMVKFEGMQGPPGTPLKTLELISVK